MSPELFTRGFFSVIVSVSLIYGIYSKDEIERLPDGQAGKRRYMPYMPSCLFPVFLVTRLVLFCRRLGAAEGVGYVLSLCVDAFIHMCFYYLILLAVMPFLRKRISARVCAALWMLPNYLYILHMNFMELDRPLAVFRLPVGDTGIITKIWLAGFAGVLIWKIGGHLIFRRRILKNARPVTDPEILYQWREELERAGMGRKKYRLVYSPKTQTPMSVGVFRPWTRVVLPERKYEHWELGLIFRHEIVHIGREDSGAKFFMAFCEAMCWFDPLMWVAAKKSAEDMELSCDETVLLDEPEGVRRGYAELLLTTAGDDSGFSTCLSSSAESMKYRLKNIVTPRRRPVGGVIAGVIFFTLLMTCGHVAFAYGEGTGREYIFQNEDLEGYAFRQIVTDSYYEDYDGESLKEYLAGLSLYKMTGNYSFSGGDCFDVTFLSPDGRGPVIICVGEETVKVTTLYGSAATRIYMLGEPVDREYIDSLVVTE